MALAVTGPADLRDAKRLEILEGTIEAGLSSFVLVGEALIEVRNSKLYRLAYPTFEAYCKGRWKFSRQHAARLMDATEVVGSLSPMGDIPTSERQARELAPVLAEHGPEVAAAVMAEAGANGKATAATVRAAAAKFRPRLDPMPYIAPPTEGPRAVTGEVIEEAPIERPDPQLWAALTGVLDAIDALSVSDAPTLAATVPDRRRAATAKRLRKLGTFLGRIAWSLESEGESE